MPATLPSPRSTSLGHFRSGLDAGLAQRPAHGVPRSAAAATATRTGADPAGAAAPRTVSAARAGVSHARSSRPRPAVWCSATTTSPSRVAGRGPAPRPARWSTAPRRPPRRAGRADRRRAGRRQGVGVRAGQRSWALHWPTDLHRSTRRPSSSERTAGRGHRRPRRHRHPHHRGQAGRPRPPARRGGARRVGQGGGEAARQGRARPPASGSSCSSTRAPSSSSTSWPGTAPRRSAWRRSAPTATA